MPVPNKKRLAISTKNLDGNVFKRLWQKKVLTLLSSQDESQWSMISTKNSWRLRFPTSCSLVSPSAPERCGEMWLWDAEVKFGPNEPRVIQNPPEKSKKTSSLAGNCLVGLLPLPSQDGFSCGSWYFPVVLWDLSKWNLVALIWAALKVLKVRSGLLPILLPSGPQAKLLQSYKVWSKNVMGEVHYPPVLAFLVF